MVVGCRGVLALLLAGGLALPAAPERGTGEESARWLRVERAAGRVSRSAEQLAVRAEAVASEGRLHSLERFRDDLARLEEDVRVLEVAVQGR